MSVASSSRPSVSKAAKAEEAARLALATAGEHGVLVFGSLYLASAIRPVMMEALKKN